MKLRLGAAVLAVVLIPLTATTTSPAHAGVDITPPEVGSCHAYTMEQGAGASDTTPVVDCAETHTALTVAVAEFDPATDWNSPAVLNRAVLNQCYPAFFDTLGGNLKVIRRSAYLLYLFIPTKAQRDAGAAWLRCDVALHGGTRLVPLQDDLALGGLPLPDSVAKCRAGEDGDYALTVCSRAHRYRATHSIRYPHSSWPGAEASQRFALRKCREVFPRSAFYYEYVVSRYYWRVGYRHVVCLKKTSS